MKRPLLSGGQTLKAMVLMPEAPLFAEAVGARRDAQRGRKIRQGDNGSFIAALLRLDLRRYAPFI